MVVSLRRDGGAPREYVFREHVSEHANELRTKQLTRADMARMTPAEIDKAMRDGLFNDLIAGK